MSWPEWAEQQPATRGPRYSNSEPDLGASFTEEPFAGIRMTREVVGREQWPSRVGEIDAGSLKTADGVYRFDHGSWSASKLLAQSGLSDAHEVVIGAKRPVRGVALRIEAPVMPFSEGLWIRGARSFKPAGQRSRAELLNTETFANWPIHLLGVRWPGSNDISPPASFVIGRAQSGIWIADVVPDYENDLINIVLGWEADQVDPFSCSVLFRCERDSAPLLASQWRISDLPGEGVADDEGRQARQLAWNERTISVVLPRGPRRTDWGMTLLGPEGRIFDELPVGPRVERIEATFKIGGAESAGVKSVSGDRRPQPTEGELHEAVLQARALEEETRARAAMRRLSTAGDLREYMRWRFSARTGELLVLDRYLLDGKSEEEVEPIVGFLAAFNRPIRALVAKRSEVAARLLAVRSEIEVRKTSPANFHDRLWIVGESGLLVGTSPNDFLRKGTVPATTALDLPFADTAGWRKKFETWWSTAEPLA